MTEPNQSKGALSTAAWSGAALGASVPATLGLVALVLEQGFMKSPPPVEASFFGYLGLMSLVGATVGALAALYSSWMAGPTYSARWLAFVAVGAMYGGAAVGSGLNHWNRPPWHLGFSVVGGGVGVLLLVLLVLRERRGDRQAQR